MGFTPLILAVFVGNTHIAEILLREGANVSMVSHSGFTAMHGCAEEGPVKAVNLLVRAGADLEAMTILLLMKPRPTHRFTRLRL